MKIEDVERDREYHISLGLVLLALEGGAEKRGGREREIESIIFHSASCFWRWRVEKKKWSREERREREIESIIFHSASCFWR